MLDLHCHILPGVDDGADVLGRSSGDGPVLRAGRHHPCRRHAALPPTLPAAAVRHLAPRRSAERRTRQRRYTRWSSCLGRKSRSRTPPRTAATSRRACTATWATGARSPCWNSTGMRKMYPPDAPELVGWLRKQGMTPIIAHPERHRFFADDPGRLRALVEAGAWLQITVDSLLGNHGRDPATSGEKLLRTYPDAVLATDAHNLRRCSGLSAGYTWVRERLGVGRAPELRARADQVLASMVDRPHRTRC